jgi:SAM-dependent methyltransferase
LVIRPVSGDRLLQDDVLECLLTAEHYRSWICDLARPWLGADPLEVGSGTGAHATQWAAEGLQVTITEAEPSRVAALNRHFESRPDISVRQLTLPTDGLGDHSAVVAINVLEHIEDDLSALRSMLSFVRPGGKVVLFVPAFQFAMSRFDRQVGHFRRYRRRGLERLLWQAGLVPDVVHYVNAPGLLAWFLMMRVARSHPRDGVALRAFDRCVPLLQRLESWRRPPFGQSLFAVGTVPDRSKA